MNGFLPTYYAALAAIAQCFAGRRARQGSRWSERAKRWSEKAAGAARA